MTDQTIAGEYADADPKAEDTAPATVAVDGVIVSARSESFNELGARWEHKRRHTTSVTVEIDTRDLQRLDLTRPIMIHQENPDD